MKFWDTSALLSHLARQSGKDLVTPVLQGDSDIAVWWGTYTELVSGACRLYRETAIDGNGLTALLTDFGRVIGPALEIEPIEAVRVTAARLLRTHVLRAGDALQLAAALAWSDFKPQGMGFVSLDKRLREAALKEGFSVLPET